MYSRFTSKTNKLNPFFFCILWCFASCTAQQQEIVAEGAELQLVSEDYVFTEGPAVDSKGAVYFTDQPNDRIMKWEPESNTVSTYLQPSGRSNGLYMDAEGNLLACADEKNEVWRIGPDKKVTVIISGYEGKKLNGPNDLWAHPQGGIYVTDPFYVRAYWNRTEKEIEQERVYYLAPGAEKPIVVVDDLVRPNGIIGTADGKTLYVSDLEGQKTYQYRIDSDGRLHDKKLFCELGSDGMTIDNRGNVYLTGKGVTIFDKNGKKIKNIQTGETWTANVTFAGADLKTLFITSMDAIYTLQMNVQGVR